MKWLACLVLVACTHAHVSEEVHRATYIKDTPALLADPDARARLLRLVDQKAITVVVPYALKQLLSESPALFTQWVDEIHHAGGLVYVPIAGQDRLVALAATSVWVDGLVSEYEYWNQPTRPLADLLALLAAMHAWDNHGHPFAVGAYLGYPDAEEAGHIAAAVDFVFLDYSVKAPDRAWNAPRTRDRFGWFADAGVHVWPIFYATGEVDMMAPLRASGYAAAEARFRADLAADPKFGRDHVAGFAYFTFEVMPW